MRIAAMAVAFSSLVTVAQHDGQRSNLEPPPVSVSGDGRYVALISYDRLVPADTNNSRDVYVLDRAGGSVVMESHGLDGGRSAEDCDHPVLSSDGRFLAYEAGDRIVWRDRIEGTATVVGRGREPSISGDGRYVAFTSGNDIALLEVFTRTIRIVSVDNAGHAVAGASHTPSVSGNGRYVTFASTALLDAAAVMAGAGDTSARRHPLLHVYVRDIQEGVTRLVSAGIGGKPADGDSWSPVISADGRAIAFASAATNLVSGDRNRSADVFLVDLATGSIDLVSRNGKGTPGNGASRSPALSSDGRLVAFQSEASDLFKPDDDINLLWDVYLFDRRTRQMTRLSTEPESPWMEASGGPSIDGMGDVIAFSSRHPIDAADIQNDFDMYVLKREIRGVTEGGEGRR